MKLRSEQLEYGPWQIEEKKLHDQNKSDGPQYVFAIDFWLCNRKKIASE